MVQIKNLTKRFGKRVIFENLNLSFPNTGVVALVGESGSGKTTLLNAIAGLDFDYSGEILIDCTNLKCLSENALSDYRIHHIGYVFQNFNLLNTETSEVNATIPYESVTNSNTKIKRRKINEIFSLLGISKLKKQDINKLSGGEKQRVAIARALINSPKVILCDEPTGALDEANSVQIYSILRKISCNSLVIISSHDYEGVSKIADKIVQIKDGKIIESDLENGSETKPQNLLLNNKKVRQPALTSSFKIKHSFHKIKAKKYRSVIAHFMLSISLTGIGLSIIITSSVSNKIQEAFSNIINGNQIVMSLKQESQNSFSNAYSAPFHNVQTIYDKYQYYLEGIGTTYLVNFENFFKDKNDFYVSSTAYRTYIPALSTRTINDFKWLDDDYMVMYPFSVRELNNDQVVLGLSYQDMVNLCFQLQIQRNFSSLGRYIYNNKMFITLSIENKAWQYDDEQIFEVVAVTESRRSVFYHSNPLWNEVVFENMMRLPSVDSTTTKFPWEMFKVYYFKTIEEPSVFLDIIFYDEEFSDYVFERTNNSYNPLLCDLGEVCEERRLFIYVADKIAIDPAYLKYISQLDSRIKDFYFTSDFGYASYASNLLSGFSKNTFVSLDRQKVEDAIDADTAISGETNVQLNLQKGVVQGNFLNGISGGLRFSTKMDKLYAGRAPKNNNEIAISKGLVNEIDSEGVGLGKYLYFAGEIEEYLSDSNRLMKEYNVYKMVIVGLVDEEQNYLYHNSTWSISFFRDQLGVSSFSLIPKSVVIELDNDIDPIPIINRFNKMFKDYNFSSPVNDLSKSIDSTLSYANAILIGFSILSSIISVLLLGTIVLLNVLESKDEIRLLRIIGIRQKDIESTFVYQSVIQGLVAFSFSAIELVVVDYVISKALGDQLNTSLGFTLNILPIAIVFLVATILPFFTSLVMIKFLSKGKINIVDKNNSN